MRQTFEVTGGPNVGRSNLPVLRKAMKDAKLDGLYIPHEDAYQNEYLPAAYDRLAWATGFTGSAGSALVFLDSAIVFVDGRYTLQAAQQLDKALFDTADLTEPGPFGWLAEQDLPQKRIGYDPELIAPDALAHLSAAAIQAGAKLIELATNPIDTAWTDQPSEPMERIVPHDIKYAGQTHRSKRDHIAVALRKSGADATIITSPASIAWLFNIRGGDVKCSPLPLARAILYANGDASLYAHEDKLDSSLKDHLEDVQVYSPEHLQEHLQDFSGKSVSLDPSLASAWFFNQLKAAGANIIREMDPIALPRACKNAVEVEGSRAAHRRDGAAMVRFLRWLETEKVQTGKVTEIDAASRLEQFREEQQGLKDLSFESISGAGPNGAVVHYRVNEATNRTLEPGTLFLIDSGGQYLDGTTDITRTVAIGEPTQEMRERYTAVLKAHIALAQLRFPAGTTGHAIDAVARAPLWAMGLDYDHGTGHGVGSYLGVHEGPQRISKAPNNVALKPGMIVSNEPGFYKTNAYGIRIENLQVVTQAEPIHEGEHPMHGFETLTLAPLDRRLIEQGMLTPTEWIWVDRYHARVYKELGELLTASDRNWLEEVCREL